MQRKVERTEEKRGEKKVRIKSREIGREQAVRYT